jgi:hypothetical protein
VKVEDAEILSRAVANRTFLDDAAAALLTDGDGGGRDVFSDTRPDSDVLSRTL